jgi:predicted adenylyl cyclase CyaB
MPLNFEFKARTNRLQQLEESLQTFHPLYIGEDHQCDTYFNVPNGRMKLREGNIENTLIHYHRINTANAKQSDVLLYHHQPNISLKQVLTAALGIKIVVDKKRKIYFIDNVKFHFDTVEGLGTFVEVEAIDKDGSIGIEKLKEQCQYYAGFFKIEEQDYMAESYSDMMMNLKNNTQ